MTATMERPTGTVVEPMERTPRRILPQTRDERMVIDLYCEGYSNRYITEATGLANPRIYEILERYDIPFKGGAHAIAKREPRILTDAEIVAGGDGMLDRALARIGVM